MAVGLGTRQAADEEARAEVEVRIIRADGIESEESASIRVSRHRGSRTGTDR